MFLGLLFLFEVVVTSYFFLKLRLVFFVLSFLFINLIGNHIVARPAV
jgi:hypothetical protein